MCIRDSATIDGVVLAPSWLAITVGFPPSITATQLFVVPKSIPIIFPMIDSSSSYSKNKFVTFAAFILTRTSYDAGTSD